MILYHSGMDNSELVSRVIRLEKELQVAQQMIKAQENMISSLTCSLQATFMMLVNRGLLSEDIEDQEEFRKLYISNMAKMDQANAGLNDRFRQTKLL